MFREQAVAQAELNISNLHYDYHNEPFEFDLSVAKGSIVALMGPSGSGKSTLLSLIAGFIQPTRGEISVNGHSILNKRPHQRPFSMLFQEHNLFSHLTVRENIGLGLHPGLKLTGEQKRQVERAVEQVGVAEYLDRTPDKLSGGQRQRVALARCFVQPNTIWLLDEPFSALDPILRGEMLLLVKQLASERRITLVMVTHHMSDAKAIATDFALISQGRVAAADSIDKLSASHSHPLVREFVRASE